jgi:hypothetical protein
VTGTAQLRLFGSKIRALAGPSTTRFAGVRVDLFDGNSFHETPGREQFHMHGGLIEVDSGTSGLDAVAIEAGSHPAAPEGETENEGAMVHVLDTAYRLTPNGGSAIRLRTVAETGSDVNHPHFHTPFRWPPGTERPFATFSSLEGADLFVETDCGSDGLCDGGPGDHQTHVMIYNPSRCPGETWFDSTAGHCRNAPPGP